MQRGLLDLEEPAPGGAQGEQFLVHRLGHVPDHLAMVGVLRRVNVEEEAHHLGAAGAELHGMPGARLREPPDLRVVEWTMGDLVDHSGPAPAGVDLVQERARRITQPGGPRLFRLQVVPFEAAPALQRIVMPRPPRHVVVAVQVAVGDDVEPGALLVGDHGRQRIAELLAITRVHHAGVEGTAPHAHVEPARPRPRSGDGGREDKVFGNGQHGVLFVARQVVEQNEAHRPDPDGD